MNKFDTGFSNIPMEKEVVADALGISVNELHDSDCSLYNEPAYPAGPCDCSVERRKSFQNVVIPVIQWLNNNGHPHMIIVIDPTNAQLLEGQLSIVTNKFVKD